jgi:hypothetical protein
MRSDRELLRHDHGLILRGESIQRPGIRITLEEAAMPPVTMDQAIAVKRRFEAEWMKLPGVTGVDAGHRVSSEQSADEVVIRVYVADRSKAPDIPSSVEGIPVVIIERRFEAH